MKPAFLHTRIQTLFIVLITLSSALSPLATGQLIIPKELPGVQIPSSPPSSPAPLPESEEEGVETVEEEYEDEDPSYEVTLADIDFVLLKPGQFTMGNARAASGVPEDERLAVKVTISKPFFMSQYEITQGQWKEVMGDNPSRHRLGDNHPVENVSWEDCQRFLKRLNSGEESRVYFRLPTESEWEYACRAGSSADFEQGNKVSDLQRVAWFEDNSNEKHQPVGKKQPNAWGLYDMLGNVYEWCEDCYADSYDRHPRNEEAWIHPNEYGTRVRRGGSFSQPSKNCRVSFRGSGKTDNQREDVGLRIVAEPR